MPVRVYSGGGNFFLLWPGLDVAHVVSALKRCGVLVRSMQGKPMLDGAFRVSVGTQPQMRQFASALASVLGEPSPPPSV
jgi:histidinol-phosphate aminotransferase